MKYIFLIILSVLLCGTLYAQVKVGFWKRLSISQSMETAETKEEPAQIQFTLPEKEATSWLLNMGLSYSVLKGSFNAKLKLTTEYHRNTLTDSKQDNLSVGFKYYRSLGPDAGSTLFLTVDPKYVYDAITAKSSIAGNLLFTYYNDKPGRFHFNSNNFSGKTGFKPSLYAGVQWQDVIKSPNDSGTGFIMRPMITTSMYYDIIADTSARPRKPVVRFSLDYTGRVDAVNQTLFKENYTDLLKIGVEWFLTYKPLRVSLGASFNNGSDPVKGLAKQQYWLLSFNIYK